MNSFRLTWKIHAICILISLLCLALAYLIIDTISMDFFIIYKNEYLILEELILNLCVYVILFMIPITIIHELIHAIAFILVGGRVRFGFKGIYAYTKETSGIPIDRTKFLIVLLAPLILISIISLFLPGQIGQITFLLNLFGSSGDICMSLFLCKCPYDSKIIDRDYGFDVI